MLVLITSIELAPFTKGPEGEDAAEIARSVAELGPNVISVCPAPAQLAGREQLARRRLKLSVRVGDKLYQGGVLEADLTERHKAMLIDLPELFEGSALQESEEGALEALAFFSRAVFELCRQAYLMPSVIHCLGWRTGPIPALLQAEFRDRAEMEAAGTVMSMFDSEQRLFPPEAMLAMRLDWSMFTPSGFELCGKTSFLKGGVAFADAITATSHEYLRQLQDPVWDPGIGQVLRERSSDVKVIGAGIDTRRWDPSADPDIEAHYDAKDPAPKRASKEILLRRLELEGGAELPLVLVAGKAGWLQGTDLLEQSADRLVELPARFLLALDADERWHRVLMRLAEKRRDRFVLVRAGAVPPGLLLAASDCLLLPARQAGWCPWLLRALRYGCVPVVGDVGFAGENVDDYGDGAGTGFTFEPGSADSMVDALRRMASLYGQRAKWQELAGHIMSLDLSWNRPARLLLKLYEQVAGLRRQ